MKKRWIIPLFCLAALLALTPAALAAGLQPDTVFCETAPDRTFSAGTLSETVTYASADFESALLAGLRSLSESIDVSQYSIPSNELGPRYEALLDANPSLFFVGGGVSWSSRGGYVTTVRPAYDTQCYPENAGELYEAAVAEALSVVEGLTDPLTRVVALHDWLVLHAAYDEAALAVSGSAGFEPSYSAYGVMVNGTGVCESYSRAFADLMQRIGVPVAYGHGPDHVWNMVQLDGEWYNVDVTWDDPTPDRFGLVEHKYLLVSTRELAARDAASHGGYAQTHTLDSSSTYDYAANSTRYDGAWWAGCDTPICAVGDGNWVTLKQIAAKPPRFQLVSRTAAGKETVLLECGDYWSVGRNSFWTRSYSGLSYCDGRFYYNGSRDVYCYDPKTGQIEAIYTCGPNDLSIYGLMVDKTRLRLAVTDDPNNGRTIVELPLAQPSPCRVLVDGTPVEFQMYALADERGNLTNYIKVRDLAYILNGTEAQFNTYWDGSIRLDNKQAYMPDPNHSEMNTPYSGLQLYVIPSHTVKLDGAPVALELIALKGGAYTYCKLGGPGPPAGLRRALGRGHRTEHGQALARRLTDLRRSAHI